MTNVHASAGEPAVDHPTSSEQFDRELDIRRILWVSGGVAAITLVSVVLMWALLAGFNAFDNRHAPAPPPMPAAAQEVPPTEPRLQPSPPADMDAMRVSEDQVLQHAAWIDRAKGTVRLPIDVAIDVIAAGGMPTVTTPSLSTMTAQGSMSSNGRPPTDQPSPGTLLPAPGMGIGSIGPPSAGAGQVRGAAMPDSPAAAPATAAPAPTTPATPPAHPLVMPPPPPPGGMP